MTFKGQSNGSHCLLDLVSYRSSTNNPTAVCPNRYAVNKQASSENGVDTEYCFPREELTTCEAVLTFANDCSSGGSNACGKADLDDGKCDVNNLCTYECGADRDCSGSAGSCQGAGTTYCKTN